MSKAIVVGIAGGTCSGKSTLAERVADEISKGCPVKLIHMDQYMRRDLTTIAPITRVEYPEHNHPDGLKQADMLADLKSALAGGEFGLIVIEGLFALSIDAIRELLDIKVFVDLKSDERLVRRINRWKDRQTMDEIAARYLDTVRFRHDELVEPSRWHADIVLNGTLDSHAGTGILTTYIRSLLVTG